LLYQESTWGRVHEFAYRDFYTVGGRPLQGIAKKMAVSVYHVDAQRIEPGNRVPHGALFGFRSNYGYFVLHRQRQEEDLYSFRENSIVVSQKNLHNSQVPPSF